MLKNYFKTAWRSLLQGKTYSLINILGLSVGMAGTVLILLWLYNEISFDKFHHNKDNLYEVYVLASSDNHPIVAPISSQPLGPYLKNNFPEVQSESRINDNNSFLFTVGSKSFTNVPGDFVDSAFLDMFDFPLVEGAKSEQLKNTNTITITQKLARKFFGDQDAMGKTVRIDSVDEFTVTGVLKDLPANTMFSFEYLLPWDYQKKIHWTSEDWLSNNTTTFLLLKPHTDFAAFSDKIKDVSRRNAGRNDIWTHFLFPLKDWHLYDHFENGKPSGGRIDTVRVFGVIAAFILLIACINFINLSTARSEQRAKEVGIRKVAGAGKNLLISQFIIEAFLTVCIAGCIALLIVQLALPYFDRLIQTELALPYDDYSFWAAVAGFVLVTSLLAGSYPAFYLSAFKPVSIFKKEFRRSRAAITPRKILVVVQFSFAIILIVSTIVVHDQVQYAQSRDKGYSNDKLIHVDFVGQIERNYPFIKQELLGSGVASSVSKNLTTIAGTGTQMWGLRWPNEIPKDTNTAITLFSSDADIVETMGLHLLEGRDIDVNRYPRDSFAVLLNEKAVEVMGLKSPIGQIIREASGNRNWHVVGVVKNFVAEPYQPIPPVVIEGAASWFYTMHIKLNASRSVKDNLARAEQIFKKYNLAYPFDYQFVDQEYARSFDNEQKTKTLAGLFAGLAIFISCLGLFGLSAYVAQSRLKEIGVRKVLGASTVNIARLLSVDFVKLVLLSIAIGSPVAWWAMNKWLADYSYRISIGWLVFFFAGMASISIALVTVSFQAVRAARANPVKTLRTE